MNGGMLGKAQGQARLAHTGAPRHHDKIGWLETRRKFIEVIKPGYKTYRGQISVPSGKAAVSLNIQLEETLAVMPLS